MKFLFPKQPAFFDYFKELNSCVKEISVLFGQFSASFNDFEGYYLKAEKIEHRADEITNKIIRELNKCFITPFDREDVYSLAYKMDTIVDLIENAIHNIYLYDIKEKEKFIDDFAKLIMEACNNLDVLTKECFENKINAQSVDKRIKEIKRLEDEGDVVFKNTLRLIFSKNQDPISVIKWKDILEDLEEVLDQFKKVSGSIVRVIVKSS